MTSIMDTNLLVGPNVKCDLSGPQSIALLTRQRPAGVERSDLNAWPADRQPRRPGAPW